MRANLVCLFLFLAVSSCAEIQESSEENTAEAALSAGVAALAGAAHALSQVSGVFLRDADDRIVSGCTVPPASDTCSSGVKSALYQECLSTATNHSYAGSVTLTFSETACDFPFNSASVTRTTSLARILGYTDFPRFNGTTVTTTTETHTNYQGSEIGGGSRLTRVASTPAYDVEILGVKKVLTSSQGKVLYDISLHTTSAMTLTGDVSGDRILNGGTMRVAHNRALYTADLTPVNLRYNSTACCHPTSGVVGVTFGDKAVGTAQITFSSTCGVATLVRDNDETTTRTIPLHGCE